MIGALLSAVVGRSLAAFPGRLPLLAACLLAAVLVACGSGSSSGGTEPSATTAASEDGNGASGQSDQSGQSGQNNNTPPPARKSFFDQLSATGEAKQVTVSGVPKGATCRAGAQIAGGGVKVPSNQPGLKPQTATESDSSLTFQLDLPEQTLKNPVTVVWTVTCQLSGETKTLTEQFKWDGS